MTVGPPDTPGPVPFDEGPIAFESAVPLADGIVPFEEVRRVLADHPGAAPEIAVSRGVSPWLKGALARLAPVVEADAVRGRAVWATAPAAVVVVEQPNWWGRLESVPAGAIVFDHRGDGWDGRVRQVRRLARSVTQIPGVRAAHDAIEAPWFVVLLPVPQERVAEALAAASVPGATAVGRRHAELPGGLRLAPPESDPGLWLRSCVACIAAIVGTERPTG